MRHHRSAVFRHRLADPNDLDHPAEDEEPPDSADAGPTASRVADYVLTERPGSTGDRVFVGTVAPHTQLVGHASIYVITAATFRKAGITGMKAGTRFPRHTAATRMLRAGDRASDDLGRARPCQPGIHRGVHECRRRASAFCPCPRPREHGHEPHGFISAFATELEGYLAFKGAMGFHGSSRIWYLKRFDAYCTRYGLTVFDRDTVEGWVTGQLQRSSRYRSWMSYICDSGRWMGTRVDAEAYVLTDAWKAPFVRADPYLFSGEGAQRFFTAAARLHAHSPWRWQPAGFFTLMHSCGMLSRRTSVTLRPVLVVTLPDGVNGF